MKRLTVLFLLLIISTQANAQQHELPFPDSNAIWIMKTYLPPDPADPLQWSSTCYGQYFSHDTSHISGMVYQNLYIDYNQSGFDFMYEDDMSSYIQLGRYRVDGQKVYYQNLISGAASILYDCYTGYHGGSMEFDEFLLYDFGLTVGDTFELVPNTFLILETIDSTLINGTYYRKFNFTGNTSYFWIEGIGSNLGFFPFVDLVEVYVDLSCFYEDEYNFIYYPNGVTCGDLSTEEIQTEPIKKVVKIVDIMGRITQEKPNTLLFYIYNDGTSKKVFKYE
jgi:hypothetical protein